MGIHHKCNLWFSIWTFFQMSVKGTMKVKFYIITAYSKVAPLFSALVNCLRIQYSLHLFIPVLICAWFYFVYSQTQDVSPAYTSCFVKCRPGGEELSWRSSLCNSTTGRGLNIELALVVCSDIITLQYEDTLKRLPHVSIPEQVTGQ